MRRLLSLAGFSVALLLATSLTLLAAPQSGALLSGGDDRADTPFPIFGDVIYRRDGALPKLKTCLAVANDPEAGTLIDDLDIAIDHSLAEALQSSTETVKKAQGFGTLLVCARIVEAWYASNISEHGGYFESQPDQDDGRLEHGTIVVDLAIDDERQAKLDPVPLVRILTSSGLLPEAVFGGIVLRNTIIDGPLVFHNAHLALPLAFAHVRFQGGRYEKVVFGKDEPVEDTALTIIHSRFDDHVQIVDSTLCGHIRIIDSVLRETLAFEDVRQTSQDDCQDSNNAMTPFMRIDGNRFEQGISIARSQLGKIKMDGNDIDSLVSSRSDFGGLFEAWNNHIGFLQFDCSLLAKRFDLSFNHIEKDAFINGSRHDKKIGGVACKTWLEKNRESVIDRPTTIVITSNQIGGGLGLQGLDGRTLQSPVNLMSNRVGNGSEIALPTLDATGAVWKGRYDFQGSVYHGTIELTQSDQSVSESREDGSYCDPSQSGSDAIFDLTAVDIRVLKWGLPLNCKYRWSGYGLTYDLWLAAWEKENKTNFEPGADDQKVLRAWRQTLEEPEAAPLTAMSSYLTDNGSSVDGRDILVEAKRLNYAPDCRPDWGMPYCVVDLFGFPWNQALAEIGSAPGENDDSGPFKTFFDVAKLILLVPAGYGAEPERALIWLIFMTVFCWIAYAGYSELLRYRLKSVPATKDKLRRVRSSLIIPTSNSDMRWEGPDKPSIEEAMAKIDSLSEEWPGVQGWPHLKRDERLEIIRKKLVPGLLDCEEKLLGSALTEVRGIRLALERFGNTEKLGFSLFDQGKMPVRFTYGRYAIDTMLPFINLHAYNNYYPEWWPFRVLSVVQHVCGWWWLTVFIASAAIL